MEKKIKIACKGSAEANIDELIVIQGNLKELTDFAYKQLKKSILEKGFSFPIFVWNDNGVKKILDGTHRKLVLTQLKRDGYIVPKIPIAEIMAKDLKEAKEKLLVCTSQYAKIKEEGLYEFSNFSDIKIDTIELDCNFSDINMAQFVSSYSPEPSMDSGPSGGGSSPTDDFIVSKEGDVWLLGDGLEVHVKRGSHVLACDRLIKKYERENRERVTHKSTGLTFKEMNKFGRPDL